MEYTIIPIKMNCKICDKKCLKSDLCNTCRKKAEYVPKKIHCSNCNATCRKKDDNMCSRCRFAKKQSDAYHNDPEYRNRKNQRALESYHRCRQKKTVELIENNNLVTTV